MSWGKDGLFGDEGQPLAEVRRLLTAGTSVVAPDLALSGRVPGRRQAAGRSPASRQSPRVCRLYLGLQSDCLRAAGLRPADAGWLSCGTINRIGPRKCTCWPLPARLPGRPPCWPSPGGGFDRAAIDTAGFRFAGLKSAFDVNFMSGIVKYGDLPGLVKPGGSPERAVAGRRRGRRADAGRDGLSSRRMPAVTAFSGPAEARPAAAVEWLMRKSPAEVRPEERKRAATRVRGSFA